MASATKPRQFDLARIQSWAAARVPAGRQDQVRIEVGEDGICVFWN
jgi:hypothetical protein